jgi:hypothetical protein
MMMVDGGGREKIINTHLQRSFCFGIVFFFNIRFVVVINVQRQIFMMGEKKRKREKKKSKMSEI